MTKIEWTEKSWNPIVGCSLVSPGCTNCYAMRQARRLEYMNVPHYADTTKVVNDKPVWTGHVARALDKTITVPLRRKKPTMYFVNSMGDLFHEDIPDEWIDQVFAVMALTPQHTYQVLTKRAERMREYMAGIRENGEFHEGLRDALIEGSAQKIHHDKTGEDPSEWLAVQLPLPNVWLGVSAEDQTRADERIPHLLNTPAAVRFVSAEPLLGQVYFSEWLDRGFCNKCGHVGKCTRTRIGLEHDGCDYVACQSRILDWIIVGGESGTGARPMHPDWARSIRDQCQAAGVSFFFKQWGEWGSTFHLKKPPQVGSRMLYFDGTWAPKDWDERRLPMEMAKVGKKTSGRTLDGHTHDDMPPSYCGVW